MSARLATALGPVRGLLSLSIFQGKLRYRKPTKKRGPKGPLFFCLLTAKAPFVRVQ
jgi:hypothetical protein